MSIADIMALRGKQLLPRKVVVWHFSNGEKLFYNYDDDEDLPIHTAYRQGLV
jgi:hypothetical protein